MENGSPRHVGCDGSASQPIDEAVTRLGSLAAVGTGGNSHARLLRIRETANDKSRSRILLDLRHLLGADQRWPKRS